MSMKRWIAGITAGLILAGGLSLTSGEEKAPLAANSCGAIPIVSGVKLVDPILSPEQLRITGIIIAEAAQLAATHGLSVAEAQQAERIGVAVAYGESSLLNVAHGDAVGLDSIGVFQQRSGWGTLAQRSDPTQATILFYTAPSQGLFAIARWQSMSLTEAGHATQRNADSNYYASFEGLASRLVAQASGSSLTSVTNPVAAPCTPTVQAEAFSGNRVPNGFIWPVYLPGSSVSSCYGPRVLNGRNEFHPGLDIGQDFDRPVYAAASGTVMFAGPVSGFGDNYVLVRHPGNLVTGYGHMNGMSVTVNQAVTQGQQIGIIGSQGYSTNHHLHFNVIDFNLPHDSVNGNVDPLKSGLSIPSGVPNTDGCS